MTQVRLAYSSTKEVVGFANDDLTRAMHEVAMYLRTWNAKVSIPTTSLDPDHVLYVECELHSSRIYEFVQDATAAVRELSPAGYGRLNPEIATLEVFDVMERPTTAIQETLTIFGFTPKIVDRIRQLAPAPKGG